MQNLNLFPERKIYSVSELAFEARGILERHFLDVWVRGEVSNFRNPQSGHFYFTLKDRDSQIKTVCFKTQNRGFKFKLEDGLNVLVRGRVSLYEARGDFQLVVDYMEPAGRGTLQFAFEQLKQKLNAEGLFDQARKKPMPAFPRKIGIVTSPTGAAIQDILRVLKRRNQQIHILIYPARVQGDIAAEEVASGVQYLNTRIDIDVIVVARGGGSMEDLAPFNDEKLARALAQSRLPVISAVGHEIDFTICDFVADLRAPTPSAAAEIVSATQEEVGKLIANLIHRGAQSLRLVIERKRSALERLAANKSFASAENRLVFLAQRLDEALLRIEHGWHRRLLEKSNRLLGLDERLRRVDFARRLEEGNTRLHSELRFLENAGSQLIATKRQRFERLAGELNAYSPLAALQRGYAIVRKENRQIIKSVRDVHIGEEIRVHVHHGELVCRVQGLKS